jgi:hypothetical protein
MKELFPERECFPLVRPIIDEKSLQKLDTVPQVRLAPDFHTCPTPFTSLNPKP